MAAEFICDGCGKRAAGVAGRYNWLKPNHWYERSDNDGIQTACSRECIENVAKETGKSTLVLPV